MMPSDSELRTMLRRVVNKRPSFSRRVDDKGRIALPHEIFAPGTHVDILFRDADDMNVVLVKHVERCLACAGELQPGEENSYELKAGGRLCTDCAQDVASQVGLLHDIETTWMDKGEDK